MSINNIKSDKPQCASNRKRTLREKTASVELRKFDPPLWHVPYGRIV